MWSLCTVQWSLRTPMLSWKGLSLMISSSFTSRDMPVWSPLIRGHSNIIYWTHTAVRNLSIDSRLHSEEFYKYLSHTKRFNQYGLFMLRTSKGSLRGIHYYFFFQIAVWIQFPKASMNKIICIYRKDLWNLMNAVVLPYWYILISHFEKWDIIGLNFVDNLHVNPGQFLD